MSQKIDLFRVIVLGKTGVGKSSLMNKLFNIDFRVSDGIDSVNPTLEGFEQSSNRDYYKHVTQTLELWDFRGFESGASGNVFNIDSVSNIIQKQERQGAPIHVVIFCNEVSRFEKPLFDAVQTVAYHNIGCVIVALIKVDMHKPELVSKIQGQLEERISCLISSNPDNRCKIARKVFLTSTKEPTSFPDSNCPTCGASEESIETRNRGSNPRQKKHYCVMCKRWWNITRSVAPETEELKRYIFLKMHNLQDRLLFLTAVRKEKKTRINLSVVVIGIAIASASVIGASPIPFSDWPLLLGIEFTLAGSLALIWSIPRAAITPKAIAKIAGYAVTSGGIAIGLAGVGKITATLLKLIPGVNVLSAILDSGLSALIVGTIGVGTTILFAQINEKLQGTSRTEQLDGTKLIEEIDQFDMGDIMSQSRSVIQNRGSLHRFIGGHLGVQDELQEAQQEEEESSINLLDSFDLNWTSQEISKLACCIICSQDGHLANFPCGHNSLCHGCAMKVITCPVCHAPVHTSQASE